MYIFKIQLITMSDWGPTRTHNFLPNLYSSILIFAIFVISTWEISLCFCLSFSHWFLKWVENVTYFCAPTLSGLSIKSAQSTHTVLMKMICVFSEPLLSICLVINTYCYTEILKLSRFPGPGLNIILRVEHQWTVYFNPGQRDLYPCCLQCLSGWSIRIHFKMCLVYEYLRQHSAQ